MSKVITQSEAEKEITKFFGDDTVFMNGNISSIGAYDVISTGSQSLDYAIGIGGIPRGRITQLAGQESSGKTMLALSCIKNYLDQNPNNTALFIDAEYTYDPEWAASQGVDVSRVMVIKTNDAKKIFEGLIGKVAVNKTTKKISKKMKGILDHIIEGTDPRFKNLGIIVLDSIAVLNTPLEMAADVGKANMAPIPRFLSTELKKLTPVVAEANVAFVGINQVRVNLGQMFGDPTTSPGGKALKHACSLMVNMAPIFSSESVIKTESGDRIGHMVRAKIGKNKVGTPFRNAEYSIEYSTGIVKQNVEALELGIKFSIVERPNNRNYIIYDEKISGKDNAIQYLLDNPDIADRIFSEVRDCYLNKKEIISAQPEGSMEENPLINSIEGA